MRHSLFSGFRSCSIQRKLTTIIAVAGCMTQLVTCAAFLGYQSLALRENLRRDLAASATMLANTSSAVLVFQDSYAGQVLADAQGRTIYIYNCIDDAFEQQCCGHPVPPQVYSLAVCGAW